MQIQERYVVLFSICFIVVLIIAIILIGKRNSQPQQFASHIPPSTKVLYFNNLAIASGFTQKLGKSSGFVIATLKNVYQKDGATFADINLDTANPSLTNTIMLLSGNKNLDSFNIQIHALPDLAISTGVKRVLVNHTTIIKTLKRYIGSQVALYVNFINTPVNDDPIYTQKDKEAYTCNKIFSLMIQQKVFNKIRCIPYVQQVGVYAEN